MRGNYYNDADPFVAAWLRELIARELIPAGEVDERSIVDVRSDEIVGFRQWHFFAGIAGWSLALDLAGWPRDRQILTGSCPCQPFSVAGKGEGFRDERDLWPELYRIIRELQPQLAAGEQVAGRAGLEWLDRVHDDLEACGYAVGAAVLPAGAVGAPHRRERLFWVADANGGNASAQREQRGREQRFQPEGRRDCAAMADANSERTHARGGDDQTARHGHSADAAGCADDGMADAESLGRGRRQDDENRGRGQFASADSDARGVAQGDAFGSGLERQRGHVDDGREPGRDREGAAESTAATGAGVEHAEGDRRGKGRSEHELWNGRSTVASAIGWDDAAWFTGADGKTRRVPRSLEPRVRGLVARLSAGMDPGWFGSGAETVPLLAQGVTNRIGLLRGYGNAIVPAVAAEFIKAAMECMP